jgi:hypothetical protein
MEQERGSTKLLKERTLNMEELQRVIKISQQEGVELIDWFPLGQPAPDAIVGKLIVTPDAVGGVIQQLLDLDRVRLKLDVFPYGIPTLDGVLIGFETPGRFGR